MVEYIGIDIGGTNIRVGAIDEKEEIVFLYKEATLKDVNTAEDFYIKLKKMIEKVPNYQQAKAIGIGAPGSIDEKLGEIITSNNLGIFKNFPVVKRLNQDFNKQIFLENDARVATLAEAIAGKGQGKKIVCYITISTGLGGGVTIDKKIYHGSNNLGAYFSRMILDGKDTTDTLISGTGLLKKAKGKLDITRATELFELEREGNLVAKEITQEFKQNLKIFLLNISCIINPDIIVLGGGVVRNKEDFLDEVIKEFKEKAHPFAKDTIIDITTLEEPGVLGAALLAKQGVNL